MKAEEAFAFFAFFVRRGWDRQMELLLVEGREYTHVWDEVSRIHPPLTLALSVSLASLAFCKLCVAEQETEEGRVACPPLRAAVKCVAAPTGASSGDAVKCAAAPTDASSGGLCAAIGA
jgi:hypothetical protein